VLAQWPNTLVIILITEVQISQATLVAGTDGEKITRITKNAIRMQKFTPINIIQ